MPGFSSPLGLMVRGPDKWASQGGAYHAARTRDGRSRQHEGIDFLAFVGQPVVAPVPVKVVRAAKPYADDAVLSGVLLQTIDGIEIKILYCAPIPQQFGQFYQRGQCIGTVQDLSVRYPDIQNHIHVEVWQHGERVDPGPWFGLPRAPDVHSEVTA